MRGRRCCIGGHLSTVRLTACTSTYGYWLLVLCICMCEPDVACDEDCSSHATAAHAGRSDQVRPPRTWLPHACTPTHLRSASAQLPAAASMTRPLRLRRCCRRRTWTGESCPRHRLRRLPACPSARYVYMCIFQSVWCYVSVSILTQAECFICDACICVCMFQPWVHFGGSRGLLSPKQKVII